MVYPSTDGQRVTTKPNRQTRVVNLVLATAGRPSVDDWGGGISATRCSDLYHRLVVDHVLNHDGEYGHEMHIFGAHMINTFKVSVSSLL